MKHLFILLSAAALITLYAPAPSKAQGIGIDAPGVGVRVGDPDRPRYREHRRSDRPRAAGAQRPKLPDCDHPARRRDGAQKAPLRLTQAVGWPGSGPAA